jgi:hypothetical protein
LVFITVVESVYSAVRTDCLYKADYAHIYHHSHHRPMGAPTSEVGYTSATTRRGDHDVYMDMWWHWKKKIYIYIYYINLFSKKCVVHFLRRAVKLI